jgi:hypothetical protein
MSLLTLNNIYFLAILVGRQWYIIVAYNCIFVMPNGAEYLFK